MSFKNLVLGLLLVGMTGGIGCNFHFREAPQSESALQLGPSESGCLSETSIALGRYFDGNSTAHEITEFWRCLDRSLQLFSERTRGAEPGIYKADELRGFLEKYFLKNKTISDNLLNELMELKKTLLGGTATSLTYEELKRTRQFFQILNEQMILLLPFMPLTPAWAIGQNASVIDAAASALESAAEMIGGTLEKTGSPYHISHLEELRKAIEGMVNTRSGISAQIHDRMPLIRAAKALLIAPPGDRINGNEWVTFLTTVSKWYSIALRVAHLQMQHDSYLTGVGRERAVALAQEVLLLLSGAAERHANQVISFAVINDLIDALQPSELFLPCPDPATTAKNRKILKNMIQSLITRIFAGNDFSILGRRAPGLGQTGLAKASEMIERWSEGQRFLEQLFETVNRQQGNGDSNTLGYYPQELLYFAKDELLENPKKTSAEAAARIRHLIRNYPPLFAADETEITFSVGAPLRRHSFLNLSQLHLFHEFADLVLTAYAEDPERARGDKRITMTELYTSFRDIEHLGYARKLFDPNRDNYTMIATRFREGTIFTYASDGDDYLNLDETTQLFAFMYSNFNLSHRIHEKLTDTCGKESDGLGPDDVFGRPSIRIDCYRREFFENFALLLKRLPDLASFYERLEPARQQEFRESLELAARLPNSSPEFMTLNDSLGFSGAVQFIEALFRRYDRMHPWGLLNYRESTAAFPIFRGAIDAIVKKKKMEKKIKPKDYEALFTYLLAFGKPPEPSFGDIASWLWWKEKRHLWLRWNLETDRLTAVRIFAELSK